MWYVAALLGRAGEIPRLDKGCYGGQVVEGAGGCLECNLDVSRRSHLLRQQAMRLCILNIPRCVAMGHLNHVCL